MAFSERNENKAIKCDSKGLAVVLLVDCILVIVFFVHTLLMRGNIDDVLRSINSSIPPPLSLSFPLSSSPVPFLSPSSPSPSFSILHFLSMFLSSLVTPPPHFLLLLSFRPTLLAFPRTTFLTHHQREDIHWTCHTTIWMTREHAK